MRGCEERGGCVELRRELFKLATRSLEVPLGGPVCSTPDAARPYNDVCDRGLLRRRRLKLLLLVASPRVRLRHSLELRLALGRTLERRLPGEGHLRGERWRRRTQLLLLLLRGRLLVLRRLRRAECALREL